LRQGIDKLTFVRANYDSLVGRFFQPITNNYTQVIVTNSQAIRATLQRVVAKPDFLFSAVDMAEFSIDRSTTVGNFNDANENPGLSGPGNIEPNMQMRYNKVGPLIVNTYNTNTIGNGLSQASSRTNFIWGSYDGSTNAPIAYPNGTSIASLEAQILFQITTALLPGGNVATNYPPTQLQSAGGLPPFTWSLASGSTALPPGLSLSASGIISGRPTTVGTYNFTVSLAGTIPGGYQRTITRPLSITISP
jgi:hypothetical protein